MRRPLKISKRRRTLEPSTSRSSCRGLVAHTSFPSVSTRRPWSRSTSRTSETTQWGGSSLATTRPAMVGALMSSSARRGETTEARTSGRGMGEGQPHETHALDLDHQDHALRRIVPHGKVLARVLARDAIHDLEVGVLPPLDHAPAELRFHVGVVKGYHG